MEIIILLVALLGCSSRALAAIPNSDLASNQEFGNLSPTSNCDVAALGEALCDKRIEVVEEKLKGIAKLVSQSKQLCEFQIKALRESGEQQKQICEYRIKEANQQISNLQKSTQPKKNHVGAAVSGKLSALYPGSRYYVSTEKLNWYLARKFCISNGMQLASIESKAESEALTPVLLQAGGFFWLSGTDLGSEGKFYWDNGTGKDVKDFTNWVGTQPDNHQGNEHCLHEKPGIGWNDYPCENQEKFICEINDS
ncbi:C-type lectin domain family 4 member K-like isoform X2 [Cloeon dipterum]|uniref:C-type lectin domain family 4 member K-like isoform X2 n=1 Tax=Cloeon dipterum TaxID=197152 RepID=UPI0032205139